MFRVVLCWPDNNANGTSATDACGHVLQINTWSLSSQLIRIAKCKTLYTPFMKHKATPSNNVAGKTGKTMRALLEMHFEYRDNNAKPLLLNTSFY